MLNLISTRTHSSTITFQEQFIRHLKQHTYESYFSIWIISHSSQAVNFKLDWNDIDGWELTDGICLKT